ncbi:MAG: hypothetical protein ACK4UO_12935 [Pseudolabrys sp.]
MKLFQLFYRLPYHRHAAGHPTLPAPVLHYFAEFPQLQNSRSDSVDGPSKEGSKFTIGLKWSALQGLQHFLLTPA